MLKPILLALAQLDDPVFLGVVLRSLAWAALAFGALLFGAFWGLHHMVAAQGWAGWWAWAAGLLGGAGAALLATWLFLPVAAAIGTFYVDRIAAAVEARHYPWLGMPRGASAWMQLVDAIAVGARVLLLSLIAIPVALLLPGPGIVLAWLIAAWAIGRGLFGAVAMRRMSRPDAAALAYRLRPKILAQGAILAAAGVLPLLNLLVPVLGTAAMVHVLHERDSARQLRATVKFGG
jgi:CysZ protein